jgi:hypothetical protein
MKYWLMRYEVLAYEVWASDGKKCIQYKSVEDSKRRSRFFRSGGQKWKKKKKES